MTPAPVNAPANAPANAPSTPPHTPVTDSLMRRRTARRRRTALIAAAAGIAVITVLAVGCAASPAPEPGSDPSTGPGDTGDVGDPSGPATPDAATGIWGHDAPGSPSLELIEDGSFTGTDGCNRLFGSWTQDGPSVEFSGVGSTRMACVDVDTWLERLHSGRVEANALHISDPEGTEIGTLDRTG